ncbi:hypothetical protein PFY12_11615 [Chryseobacterium camelliae]|uniref:Carboxypeptidase regulatory-like domain-containing protein n=1 Tax=Chryseobacterium camelliae TaxID=1265445 RepID=A0ABY7QJ83_9FLAO|nr:hypothetical protein [Chryseobacterium camelliae]WBV59704.1 hypothetical protein PFY12_11615 [Chryseobacterium camelliae]
MKLKLLFTFFVLFFINMNAQNYIFGKINTENGVELKDATVINIRTNERVVSNDDGHFMISGRVGDELRIVKSGYERVSKKVNEDNVKSSLQITLIKTATLIDEVEIKKGITGDLSIDSKNLNQQKKVQKLKSELTLYMSQKSDPRVLAARPGEFVQPKGQGFSIGKVKNKWDDIDFMKYLISVLGEQYFIELKIEKPQIQHFIYYVFAGGFERKNILKYGYCSDADLMRFQRAVLVRIASYRAPQTQK